MSINAGDVAFKVIKKLGDEVGMGGMAGILKDHKGWDPVVPADVYSTKPVEVGADGNVECPGCKSRVPYAGLELWNSMYVCRPCAARQTQAAAAFDAAQVDVDSVKLGRGRWWVLPLVFAGAIAICVGVYFA